MLRETLEGRLDSWSVRFSYEHFRSGRYALLPGGSFLRPIGFDGSGLHCRPNPLRWLESLRHAPDGINWPESPELNVRMNQALKDSFSRHHRWAVRLGVVRDPVS
jgi:hypothetical protein